MSGRSGASGSKITKTAHEKVENGLYDKSKTASIGRFWMTKTPHAMFKMAHTKVQKQAETEMNKTAQYSY